MFGKKCSEIFPDDANAGYAGWYRGNLTTTMTPDIRDLADVLHRAAQQVELATKGLRNLKDPQSILKRCVDINRLENEADQILRRAVARLFKESKDAIEVIKWKEIYESLENATDRCEDVANIIEGVVLEHA